MPSVTVAELRMCNSWCWTLTRHWCLQPLRRRVQHGAYLLPPTVWGTEKSLLLLQHWGSTGQWHPAVCEQEELAQGDSGGYWWHWVGTCNTERVLKCSLIAGGYLHCGGLSDVASPPAASYPADCCLLPLISSPPGWKKWLYWALTGKQRSYSWLFCAQGYAWHREICGRAFNPRNK